MFHGVIQCAKESQEGSNRKAKAFYFSSMIYWPLVLGVQEVLEDKHKVPQ